MSQCAAGTLPAITGVVSYSPEPIMIPTIIDVVSTNDSRRSGVAS